MEKLYKEIQDNHKTRFYPGQKRRFREYAIDKFKGMGYENVTVDRHKNIIVGDIDKAKYVASGHYDTPPLSFYITPFTRIFGHIIGMIVATLILAVVIFVPFYILSDIFDILLLRLGGAVLFFAMFFIPNPSNANDNTSGVVSVMTMAQKLKDNANLDEYAFILFNNEELGLLGSNGLRKDYKKRNNAPASFELYNFDCVALGTMILISAKKPCSAKDKAINAAKNTGIPVKTIKAGLFTAASDNLKFANSVMVTGVKKSLIGLFYLPKIHMPNDNKYDASFTQKLVDIVIDATSTN